MTAIIAFNRWFHEHVTLLRVTVFYFTVVVLALGISLPIVATLGDNARSAHRERGTDVALSLAAYVDDQLARLYRASNLLEGFVASGAPLLVPPYFDDAWNKSDRVLYALTPSTPGALGYEAYLRLRSRIDRLVDGGIWDAFVMPAGVAAYTSTRLNPNGLDYLNLTSSVRDELEYIIATGGTAVRGPIPSAQRQNHLYIAIRTPIFDVPPDKLSSDPRAIDLETGHHINYEHFWGAISVLWDLTQFAANGTGIHALPGPGWAYMLEAMATTENIESTNYTLLADWSNGSVPYDDAVAACTQTYRFEGVLCFRVRPLGQWDGDSLERQLVVDAVLCVFIPLVILLGLVLLARLVSGKKRSPLRFAPVRTPFHAVCVDMVSATKLWAEAPFVMNEVTSIFTHQLETLADEHHVFVAARLGNTVVAVSEHRSNLLRFTEAMSTWAVTFKWPVHITIHCPPASLHFSFVLHTCYNATLRLDHEVMSCDVSGSDMQLLLLMRAVAVPQHVLCTGEFLGSNAVDKARRPPGDDGGEKALSVAVSSDRASLELAAMRANVRELGYCELPLQEEGQLRQTWVNGFLVPSAATEGRRLVDVIDSFPDWIWSEWRTARGRGLAGGSESPRNPFANFSVSAPEALEGYVDSHSLTNTAAGSKILSLAASKRVVTDAHINNEQASSALPGSAVEEGDARKLAYCLAPLFAGTRLGAETPNPDVFRVRLRMALSLATYYLVAYRIVFAPVDHDALRSIMAKLSANLGLPLEDPLIALAARCSRVSEQRYINDGNSLAGS
jgi:hypothetical protein